MDIGSKNVEKGLRALVVDRPPAKDGVNETREVGVKSVIIGITSHKLGAIMDEFIAAGLDECLTKPLGPEVILRLINQLVA